MAFSAFRASKKLEVRSLFSGAMSLVLAVTSSVWCAPALAASASSGRGAGAGSAKPVMEVDVDQALFKDYWAEGKGEKPTKFKKASKKRGPASSEREPSSISAVKSAGAIKKAARGAEVDAKADAPSIKRFSIRGEEFRLIEYRNKFQVVIRQILMGKDFVQVANGSRGIASLDSWEYETGDLRISMSGPINGAFQMMTAQKRTRGATIEMKFARTSKGDYRLYSARPMKMQFASGNQYDDFVVGCASTDTDLQKLAAELNSVLSSQGDSYYEDIVKKNLLKNCDASPFGSSVSSQIATAVNRVAKSDLGWNESSIAGNTRPATKGTFLQCLRYFDLATHASRISAALAQYDPKVVAPADKKGWSIKCDASTSNLGEATIATALRNGVITLGSPANQKSKYPNDDPATAYAKTFFHEMLHVSGIDDETLTGAIESCCGSEGENAKCETVRSAAANQKRKQSFESELINKLGGETYADLQQSADYNLRDGWNMIDTYLGDAAMTYQDMTGYPRCQGTDGHLTEACNKEYQAAIGSISETYFGANGICSVNAKAVGQTSEQATQYCKILRQTLEEKITGINSADLSDFCTAHAAKAGASLIPLKAWEIALNWLNPQVSAVTDDRFKVLCKVADAKDIDPNPAGYDNWISAATTDQGVNASTASNDSRGTKQGENDSGDKAGANSSVATGNNSSSSYRDTNAGPSGRNYSNDHQTRSEQILADIRRQQDTGSRVNTTTASVLKSFFPDAQASETKQASNSRSGSKGSSNGSNTMEASGSAGGSSGSTSTVQVQLPKISIPDPTTTMANGSSALQVAMKTGAIGLAGKGEDAGVAAQRGLASASSKMTTAAAAGTGASLAGMVSPVNAKNAVDPKKALELKLAEERGLKALLAFLLRPYEKVKGDLERKAVMDSMVHYNVQAVDKDGRVHGSGFPKYKLVYNESVGRLIFAKEKTDR